MPELLSDAEAGVLTLTLNRPQSRNAVSYSLLDNLIEAFEAADSDPSIRAIIVTGSGDSFSYGTDLAAGGGGLDVNAPGFKPLRGTKRDVGGVLALRLFSCTKPVIAAVNGTAVGVGVTMILPMDVRIAADSARFGLPFTRRGIVPESCATWFLPRIVGIATAIEWCVTGRVFDAQEAAARGLVSELLPAEQVLPRAREIAAQIAEQASPLSVALTRQMLWRQLGSPHPMSANRLESQAFLSLGGSADTKEGIAAFKEKRKPHFTTAVPDDLPAFYPWFADEEFADKS
ncbi:enoyl-CoA hydratase-related protein [Mycobacterium sp. UM_CSW]|uniref:enoyl-CoA hydratase-related protein n=1 Tax=Mycobacterium sp. UM_CSW TaxID=1370119 RepID=UPI000413F1C2|nr:enoyl-CoA hydratase-related protein [Mycobacterium sp. UM_CSW]